MKPAEGDALPSPVGSIDPAAPHDWEPFGDDDARGRFSGYVSDDGWVYWRRMASPEVRVRVDSTGERIAITAVLVLPREDALQWPPTVSASDLRDVPLGQLEAMMNEPELAAFIRRSHRESASKGGASLDDYLGQNRAHFRLAGVSEARRPDRFYAELAFVWAQALRAGHRNPATLIAQANEVSTSAVYRWVREARRRGVMAPSSRALAAQQRAPAARPHDTAGDQVEG